MKQFEIIIQGDSGANLEPFYANFNFIEEAQKRYPTAFSIKEMEIEIPFDKLTNKQKFHALVTWEKKSGTWERLKYRKENKHWLSLSFGIAYEILCKNDELKLSKEEIAEKLEITIKDVNKILSGNFNLDLNLLSKIEKLFNIEIFCKKIKNWQK